MSWSNRRHFLKITAAAALLSGCGFTPVYAPGGSADGLRGAVTIAEPSDSNSYEFVKRMEERLGRNLSAPLSLGLYNHHALGRRGCDACTGNHPHAGILARLSSV